MSTNSRFATRFLLLLVVSATILMARTAIAGDVQLTNGQFLLIDNTGQGRVLTTSGTGGNPISGITSITGAMHANGLPGAGNLGDTYAIIRDNRNSGTLVIRPDSGMSITYSGADNNIIGVGTVFGNNKDIDYQGGDITVTVAPSGGSKAITASGVVADGGSITLTGGNVHISSLSLVNPNGAANGDRERYAKSDIRIFGIPGRRQHLWRRQPWRRRHRPWQRENRPHYPRGHNKG